MVRPLVSTIAATVLLATHASAAVFPRVESSCNVTALDNSTYNYNVTEELESIWDIAHATGRGVCDIGRHNIMADVSIPASKGQSLIIPPQVCDPDWDSCVLKESENPNRTCLLGGPRLYYTQQNDTYNILALRLGMNVSAITSSDNGSPGGQPGNTNASAVLDAGQFIKIPQASLQGSSNPNMLSTLWMNKTVLRASSVNIFFQCDPSQCVMQPYSFEWGVYKDLADKYNTTVGQILMLSPTYTYSSMAFEGGTFPPITLAINCTLLSDDWSVLQK